MSSFAVMCGQRRQATIFAPAVRTFFAATLARDKQVKWDV